MAANDLYTRAGPDHRWKGKLAGLLPSLRTQAFKRASEASDDDRKADKDWAWVVLVSGALVALRVRGDLWMRLELRIAREAPKVDDWRVRWERELSTFLNHFDILETDGKTPAEGEPSNHWWRHVDREPADGKGPEVRFLQLRKGEVRPGKACCYRCSELGEYTEVDYFPAGGVMGQRCGRHMNTEPSEQGSLGV